MNIYVAAASSEIVRAKKWMAALRAHGFTVTSSWPEVIETESAGVANPMAAPRSERMRWAAKDLSELASSNALWFLLPTGAPTAGAYTEFGYALLLGALAHQAREAGVPNAPTFDIITSGKETSIFTSLAGMHCDEDEDAFTALCGLKSEAA